MNKMVKQSDWATGTIMEVPFWRNGMTPEEYEVERKYFHSHWEDFTKGKYVPLWKQIKASKIIDAGDVIVADESAIKDDDAE